MRIFSGIQPTGNLHIGNYLGAVKQWVELQNENDAIYCIVDEHAITVPQEPEKLRQATLDAAITILAAGIDPDKSLVFIQSHVPAHAELGWILNTLAPLGELMRMTQFKGKAPIKFEFEDIKTLKIGLERINKDIQAISVSGIQDALKAVSGDIEPIVDLSEKRRATLAGLFNYPTLMAADILLYQTEGIPVGEDQVQHIELARSLAERFNNRFGETFVIPKPLLKKEVARIMSLTDPAVKMSKSDESDKSRVNLLDAPDAIRQKIKSAVTDSGAEVKYDEKEKTAISNLLNIYSGFSGKSIAEIEKEFNGKSYAEFKDALAEVIVEALTPFQQRYQELQKEKTRVIDLLKRGSQKAASLAAPMLQKVKEKIGFLV
ncbi:MAG: tryptophan--tRNA ligase [Candidatus Sungbacteria bacterium]|nr:tryptophan--tRNA ligase [Candidatus Sungbacteria bacterium]